MTETKSHGLRVLTRSECVELLESTPVGRIGLCTEDGPLVLPVNFKWADDSIVFRTHIGQKLHAAVQHERVCFEVDQWTEHPKRSTSVVVLGRAHEVTDWAEKEQLETLGLVPWTRDAWRRILIRIDPIDISGRGLD